VDQGPSETANRNLDRWTLAQGTPMIEYAILIVMVVFAIGFAWLWVIEQRNRKKRKALQQNGIER
jgi:MFS-type transporter involved in bile tolerance (Atg22 family)